MPQELFPTAVLNAMIPYVDHRTAHSLELMLEMEKLHSLIQVPEDTGYDLIASEARGGGQIDLEGMLQAVQAVSGPGNRRMMDQMMMLLQMRKVMTAAQTSTANGHSMPMEALTALLGPEQKKQMDEMLPLLAMLQEGKMPI